MSKKIVLAGACRTAIGKMGGALSNVPAATLGAIVIKEALNLSLIHIFLSLELPEAAVLEKPRLPNGCGKQSRIIL